MSATVQAKSPYTRDEALAELAAIPGWEISPDGKWLSRRFTFKNFMKALEFVNAVAPIAEEQKHHPDLTFSWGYCQVNIQTHDLGGIGPKDFRLAQAINTIEM